MVPTPDSSLSEESSPSRCSFSTNINQKLAHISSAIHKHWNGEKKMHLYTVKKIAETLKSIEDKVFPTDKSFVSAAKNMLSRIRKELATESRTSKTRNFIGWRTRSTDKFLKFGSSKRKVKKSESLLGSLCRSRDSSLPNTVALELLTDDYFITQEQVQESDVAAAAPILIKNIPDQKEQVSTNNDTQISLMEISSESNPSEKISDHTYTSNSQETQTAQTNIEADTDPQHELPPEPMMTKSTSNETELMSSTNSMQISSGSFPSSRPEDIQNYIFISPLQETQPNVESGTYPLSFNEANISNEQTPSQNKNDDVSPTCTDTQLNSVQIGSKSQISNFEESQPTTNSHQELNNCGSNFKSSINIISNVRLRSPNVSPDLINLDSSESFFEKCRTDDTAESQQKESSISNGKYEVESVDTQATKDPQSLSSSTDPVRIIYEEQQLILSEDTENQTTNSSQMEANIAMPQPVKDNSDKGIFLQPDMESCSSQQSSEIIPGTLQTYYFDPNVAPAENKMTQYFVINHDTQGFTDLLKNKTIEPKQTNNSDADEPVQEKKDQSVIWLDVSLVDVSDMDLTDAGDSCIVEGDPCNDQSKKKTKYFPVSETQASLIFGLSKPESTNNNVFPAQQLPVTQTNENFESQSDTETIVPETIYTQSQNLDSKSPRIKSPYKNTQSSSFLTYKATAKSRASLAKPKGSEPQVKKLIFASSSSSTPSGDNANSGQKPSRNIFNYSASDSSSSQDPQNIVKVISQSPELQSQNLMLINGCFPENSNTQNYNEAPYAEREEKLVEKVMRRRERRTADEWKEMPMSEKVSGMYADKFHVRIFDDPVESLTNIRYKPSFSTFTFPRLTLTEVHDVSTKTADDARKIDSVLKNVIDKLKDQSLGLNFYKRLGNVDSSADSDSSEEERKFNRRWLREYRSKTRTQNRCLMVEPEKEKPDFTSRRAPRLEIDGEKTEEKKDEAIMVDLMEKFGQLAWLKS
ncbi:unnamed protein product [Ceutorhynchus assimilis]|uniref:Uncharacterized protein n=1 Tax=Ceutorhynchus assimilis TaxID=467358 RepID=A0A9N9MSR3_9CUCU|nr:unnamed protein product [Ceutorhynchus assimilis]